jgi:hypothetical protein
MKTNTGMLLFHIEIFIQVETRRDKELLSEYHNGQASRPEEWLQLKAICVNIPRIPYPRIPQKYWLKNWTQLEN